MPAQARTVVMPATIVAVSRAFKDSGLAIRADALSCVLWGSPPMVAHVGGCGLPDFIPHLKRETWGTLVGGTLDKLQVLPLRLRSGSG